MAELPVTGRAGLPGWWLILAFLPATGVSAAAAPDTERFGHGRPAPAGTVAAPGAARDPATGLPTRIVHRASGIALVLIPAGEFLMGSPESEPDRDRDERRHRRVIRASFYMGETEVTLGQFRAFVEATGYRTDAERGAADGEPRRGAFAATPDGDRAWSEEASWRDPYPNLPDVRPREDHPAVQVSWNDARAFGRHHGLRLPSEAEWEHACRAGGSTRFAWGEAEAAGAGRANVADSSALRRFPNVNWLFPFDDGEAFVAPVGRYRPNPWGLHDMIGNVEEWCEDAHGPYPADGADGTAARGDSLSARVTRGGSWLGNPGLARAAARPGMRATSRRDFIGFRVALDGGA